MGPWALRCRPLAKADRCARPAAALSHLGMAWLRALAQADAQLFSNPWQRNFKLNKKAKGNVRRLTDKT